MASDIGDITWSSVTFWPTGGTGLWPELAAAQGYPISTPTTSAEVPRAKKEIVFPPNMNAATSANKDLSDTAKAQAEAIQQFCETYFTLLEDHEELVARVTELESTVSELETRLSSHEGATTTEAHSSG